MTTRFFSAIAAIAIGTLAAPAALSQQVVASYQFESADLSSTHTTPNLASDITLTQSNMFWFEPTLQETLLCFPETWNADGTLSFVVTPAPGEPLDLTSFEWTSWKDRQTSPVSVDDATVFVNGIQVGTFDPLLPIAFNQVDLSAFPALQGLDSPITFTVDFGGRIAGRNTYEIRSMTVNAKACVQNITGNARTFFLKIGSLERRWRSLDGMNMAENGDGTATMSGAIENLADPCLRFTVDLTFTNRVDPLDMNYPPAGSPFTGPIIDPLIAGGTVDPNTWHYYETVTGTLTGRRCLEGAVIDVVRTGSAFQVGEGANFFDTNYGGTGGFLMTTTSQPTDPAFALDPAFVGAANVDFGADCDCFGGEVAMTSTYGTGVAGCGGVPSIAGTPPLTNTDFVVSVGNTTMMSAMGVLAWGLQPVQIAVPLLGGDLLVDPVFLTIPINVPAGGLDVPFAIPESSCFLSKEYFIQAILVDTCAPAGFALSQGLTMFVGDL